MSLQTFEKLPFDRKERILSAGIRAFSKNSYKDVSTDSITKSCQISKGLLFHYFGSKKEYYLYCLDTAMSRLTEQTDPAAGNDFYEILFSGMAGKISLCLQHRDEMHLVNMASRDASTEISAEKVAILSKYTTAIQSESMRTLHNALAALPLKEECRTKTATEGIYLYIHAVLNRYLLVYQQNPDQFFENIEQIKAEMKEYLDLILYGICN